MTDNATASLVQANVTVQSTLAQISIALVLLLALWPVRPRAAALLRRWGVDEPTEFETDEALRYLRRRRLAYPGLYLALTLGASLWLPVPALVLAVLLAGGLLAEALESQRGRACAVAGTTARRPTAPQPSPHQLSTAQHRPALVPWWSFTLAGLLLGAVVLLSGAALLEQAWALRAIPAPRIGLWLGSAAVLVSAAVIWLAVHRPTRPLARADATLRLPSARVSLGLAMLSLAAISASGGSAVGLVVAALGVAGALATTAPVRTRRPRDPRRSDSTPQT